MNSGRPIRVPRVIFLFGPPASGKFTIGSALSRLTGLPLFHNHLVVDALLAVFPFGTAPFRKHRERIWLDVIADCVAAGQSLIFTFNPERTVDPKFPARLRRRIVVAGGTVAFVEVTCDESEIMRRTSLSSRASFGKLNSPSRYRELKRQGAFDYPLISSDYRLDSTHASARESAKRIAQALGLRH